MSQINDVIKEVYTLIKESGNRQDLEYFEFHRARYIRMATSVMKISEPAKTKVLEIGSHYLHSSVILKKLGFDVHAMDVSEFWNLDFVIKRKELFGITKIAENNLEQLVSLEGRKDEFDLILFTEIFEHITFNPINFWEKIHELTKSGGRIYISTPNSITLVSIIRTIKKLLMLKGIGIPISEIFSNVTYGHHWKEYSAREIKMYFKLLSDDFHVQVKKYHYKKYGWDNFTHAAFKILTTLGNATYIFSDELEAIITVEKKGAWKIHAPKY